MEKKISFNDIDFAGYTNDVKTFEVEFLGKKYNINAVKRLSLQDEVLSAKTIVSGTLVRSNGEIAISTEDPIVIDEYTEYNPSYRDISFATTILHMYTDMDLNGVDMDDVNLFVDVAKNGDRLFYTKLLNFIDQSQIERIHRSIRELFDMYKTQIKSGLAYKKNICNAIDVFASALDTLAASADGSTAELNTALTELSAISDNLSNTTNDDIATAMVKMAK